MIIAQEITFANDSKLEVVNYPHFLVRVKVKQIYAVLQFNQNNGIELAEKQTKQSRTLHSYGISGITASRYFFRTQFPSLGFFINKKIGNRKN